MIARFGCNKVTLRNPIKPRVLAVICAILSVFAFASYKHQPSGNTSQHRLTTINSVRSGYISTGAFSCDGRLFSAVVNGNQVKQWETSRWSERHALPIPIDASSLTFSPNGALVAWEISSARTVTIFIQSFNSGRKFVRATKILSVYKNQLFFDNNNLIVATENGIRMAWDVSSVFPTNNIPPNLAPAKQSSVSRSSTQHLLPLFSMNANDDTVRIIDRCTGKTINVFHHSSNVYCASVSMDGTRTAAGGREAGAEVWNTHTGKLLYAVSQPRFLLDDTNEYEILAVAFSHSGNLLATGDQHGRVQLWDGHTGKFRTFFQAEAATSLTFSPDDNILVVGNGLRGFQVCRLHFY